MAELKAHHLLSLAHLLSVGAASSFVHTSTISLGNAINRSQQAASTHLAYLEQIGYIKRQMRGGKSHVMVTKKGIIEVQKISSALSKSLNSKPNVRTLRGKISSGVGEGAYYMSLAGYVVQFKKKIGYIPYPGTLNILLDDQSVLGDLISAEPDAIIEGFSDGKRTYGWVRCYKCTLRGKKSHLIRLERTHHDEDVVEIISKSNLRRVCNLDDGSAVDIQL